MIIIPAIDILDAQCVRLVRGEYGSAQKVAEDPLATAKYFESCGAKYIHMVDLNGAKEGKPVNAEIFIKLAGSVNVPVELGGGIRDMEAIDYYIQNGISRIILGSAILKNKDFAKEAAKKHGEKIAAGIDAKNRKVQTSGWLEENEIDFTELAMEMAKIGIKNIIYTDISVDGTLKGANLEHYKELKNILPSGVDITASGGVGSMQDIKCLCELGIYGAICGKAIYSGDLDLKEAIEYTRGREKHPFWVKT
ncbi:MAG: 1-(5-phosphoribosyl)-5-[(5-phosphoribosylamino)methylideneamino]imidazole-4-carboxamide isomerase [Oscillospiraceae bacterium]|nr:1-(5-phosphoribosyl)-5-[(5-phosphoribosylamino)methylideneamino]imidazole-4-carboxamide isomerase [Oscillospiraceae bacterium]